jgi:pimeloyl-ACP methyl ester carboxylesterase
MGTHTLYAIEAALASVIGGNIGSGWALPLTLGTAGALAACYLGISAYVARRLAYSRPLPVGATPADCGLDFRDVAFPSRDDGVLLRGWLIPGVRPDGRPTLQRTILAVHGAWQNRADPAAGLNDLCCALARAGFAVLAFDMRGHGESDPAPFTLGYHERRDVLGAVDFLRHNVLPYPDLERPQWIAGLGISMGANALLYAAAHEPDIKAIVADSAYAEMAPTLARELPRQSRLPAFFTRGTLLAARVFFGVDAAAIRPVEAVVDIAPRPLLFIQGAADGMNPPESLTILASAARKAPGAHVTAWRVPGTPHVQAFHQEGDAYVSLVASFLHAAFAHEAQLDEPAAERIAG